MLCEVPLSDLFRKWLFQTYSDEYQTKKMNTKKIPPTSYKNAFNKSKNDMQPTVSSLFTLNIKSLSPIRMRKHLSILSEKKCCAIRFLSNGEKDFNIKINSMLVYY